MERRRLQLVEGLDASRYEQRFVCTTMRGAIATRLVELGVSVEIVPGPWKLGNLEAIARIMRLVDDWSPHIVHGAVFEGVVMAAASGYLSGTPHVIIEETGGTPARSWRGDMLMSIASLFSSRCVAVSPHIARYLAAHSHIVPPKLRTITNGTTLHGTSSAAEAAAERARLGIPQQATVIGSVGRMFDHHKRFSDLVEAFAQLGPDPDGHLPYLVIAGDGKDLPGLRELGERLGVAARIRWLGYVGQPHRVYGMLDIFALVSAFEAFGLVVVEAMSAGVPVIASRVDAFPDIVDEGTTGLLVPPKQPGALAAALRTLMGDPDRRRAMGAAARVVAQRDYSAQRYVRDVDAFYRDLLDLEH